MKLKAIIAHVFLFIGIIIGPFSMGKGAPISYLFTGWIIVFLSCAYIIGPSLVVLIRDGKQAYTKHLYLVNDRILSTKRTREKARKLIDEGYVYAPQVEYQLTKKINVILIVVMILFLLYQAVLILF